MAVIMEHYDRDASLPRPSSNTEAVFGHYSQAVALRKGALRKKIAELYCETYYWGEVLDNAFGDVDTAEITRLSVPTPGQVELARQASATIARGDPPV